MNKWELDWSQENSIRTIQGAISGFYPGYETLWRQGTHVTWSLDDAQKIVGKIIKS